MTDLTKMWAALARYQSYADADGPGNSWRKMCSERTTETAAEAWAEAGTNAEWASAAWAASAAYAAAWAAAAKWTTAEHWSDIAISRIERAIKDRNDE